MAWSIEETAPFIAGYTITEEQCENFIAARDPAPQPASVTPPTKAQIVAIADDYFKGVRPSRGLIEWAEREGLKVAQVKQIVSELRAIESAVAAESDV
jgi:hypothetical protein